MAVMVTSCPTLFVYAMHSVFRLNNLEIGPDVTKYCSSLCFTMQNMAVKVHELVNTVYIKLQFKIEQTHIQVPYAPTLLTIQNE